MKRPILNILEQAAEVNQVQSDEEIRSLTELCQKQIQIEDELQELEQQVIDKTKELNVVSMTQIPEKAKSLGFTNDLTLTTGEVVVIKDEINCSFSKQHTTAATVWMHTHNHSDLFQTKFTMNFQKGEETEAKKVETELLKLKVDYTRKEGVHAATLKSFCKEQIESGEPKFAEIKKTYFNVFEYQKSYIQRRDGKKFKRKLGSK